MQVVIVKSTSPRETGHRAVDEPGLDLNDDPRRAGERFSGGFQVRGPPSGRPPPCGSDPQRNESDGVRAADDRPAGPAAPRRTVRIDGRAPAVDRPAPSRHAVPGRHPRRVPRHRPLRRAVPGQTRHHAAPGRGHRRQRPRVADARAAALGARVQHDPAVAGPDRDRHEDRRHAGSRREPAHQRPRHRRRRERGRRRSSPPSTSSTARRRIKLTFADGSSTRRPSPRQAARTTSPSCDADDAARADRPRHPRQPGALHIGSEAYVVGNPFGLYGSLSTGVVSGLDRSFQLPDSEQVITGLIQVDAAVNPGNSGGPLLDRDGQRHRHRHRPHQPDQARTCSSASASPCPSMSPAAPPACPRTDRNWRR